MKYKVGQKVKIMNTEELIKENPLAEADYSQDALNILNINNYVLTIKGIDSSLGAYQMKEDHRQGNTGMWAEYAIKELYIEPTDLTNIINSRFEILDIRKN